ncbi:hypothetical protein BLA29_006879, partial [Euroglyphus maynei]
MIIIKLFPFRVRTSIEFTENAINRKDVSMVSIQNNLLLYSPSPCCLYAYHLDEILKLNGIEPTTLIPYDYNHDEQFLSANRYRIQQMSQRLFQINYDSIEFIQPIPWLFYVQRLRRPFIHPQLFVYEFKSGKSHRIDTDDCENYELFQHRLYFDGIRRLIYHVTANYLAIYRHSLDHN